MQTLSYQDLLNFSDISKQRNHRQLSAVLLCLNHLMQETNGQVVLEVLETKCIVAHVGPFHQVKCFRIGSVFNQMDR